MVCGTGKRKRDGSGNGQGRCKPKVCKRNRRK